MNLVLTLVGMSNTGKTHWSKRFAEEQNFHHINCDDEIEKLLEKELSGLGLNGIEGVAEWMGQPYEHRFENAQKRYMELEEAVMERVLEQATQAKQNTIIDTTGSVIYCSPKLLEKLRGVSKVVSIKTPESHHQEMFKSYIQNPKPVIWGDSFKQNKSDSNHEALCKSYPELLRYRANGYSQLAHLEIELPQMRSFQNTDQLLNHIHDSL